ncbi:MAG: universal stress protein [Vulcanimicrobiota bacterium]
MADSSAQSTAPRLGKGIVLKNLNHILFVTDGLDDDTGGITATLRLARAGSARITILLLFPALPVAMRDYQEPYEAGLRGQLEERLNAAAAALGHSISSFDLNIVLDSEPNPAFRVIHHAEATSCDLVLKQAQTVEAGRGFRAQDMVLLRKCPCPLWLHRPPKNPDRPRVAVAIDPEPEDEQAQELPLRLLKVGSELALSFGRRLNIVTCWDYPFANYLGRNAWYRVSEEETATIVRAVKNKNAAALEALIARSGIDSPYTIRHIQGAPTDILPEFVTRQDVDVLVMGTLGRSGLSGLLIGNTCEDIMRQLDCSVFALKPV